jgi:hypothetical protein
MPDNTLVQIIAEQTQVLYKNIEAIFDVLLEPDLADKDICDWPLGEQIYHLLHSIDQWFINPNGYEEPLLQASKDKTGKGWTKSELSEYYREIKTKVTVYLESLSPDLLKEKPEGCQFSRLALVLGQYRHFMYHIGLIHGCLRIHTGGTNPAYFGLGKPI